MQTNRKVTAHDQGGTPLPEEDTQTAPGLLGSIAEVVMNPRAEVRSAFRRVVRRQVDDQGQWLIEWVLIGRIHDVRLGILVEVALVKRGGVERIE
jgi:hypothetical protein